MAKLSFRQQLEGFPKWQVFVFSVSRLGEPISFTSLFPYLYFMIRDFGVAKSSADIATYAGYLAASFSFCQFLFALRWGLLSDRIGRKNTLLIGGCGFILSVIMFGFAKSYAFAFFARCCMGTSFATGPVLRAVIAEIAPEKRHHALAFTTIPLAWNLGSVLGPMIGGSTWLTRPKVHLDAFATDLGLTYDKFMNKFPYALVNIVVAGVVLSSVTFTFLFFEETNEERKHIRDYGLEIGDFIIRSLGFETPTRPWLVSKPDETTRLDDEPVKEVDNTPYREIFTTAVVQALLANFLLSAHNVIYTEFLPILLAGDLRPDGLEYPNKIASGFGFTTGEIGSILSVTGLVGGLSVIVIFPYADYYFSTLNVYRFTTLFFPFIYATIPYLIFTLPEYNPNLPKNITRILLWVVCGTASLSGAVGFSAIIVLVHRVTPAKHRSIINGTLMLMTALARFCGPIVWGYVTSMGQRLGMAQLPWLLLSFICIFLSAQGFTFSEQVEEEDEEEEGEICIEEERLELLEDVLVQYSSINK